NLSASAFVPKPFTPFQWVAQDDIEIFRGKTTQFIFCSTVNVFSAPAKRYPLTNESDRFPIREFDYAYEKAEMERMFEQAASDGAFNLTIIRPSATYNETWLPISMIGGGEILITRILEGKLVLAPGDGNSIWSSTYRDDCARAFLGAVMNPKAYGKAYNLVGDELFTWEEYYNIVAEAWDAPKPTFVHAASDLISGCLPELSGWVESNFRHHVIFDSSDAKRDLGYVYRTTWLDGAKKQRQWQDDNGGFVKAYLPIYDTFIDEYNKMSIQLKERIYTV
ncbi:MAG: NAD-dependent epimerase/dehydratase family protein, partial [Oscillospiraceae bacterium]|nr:NAD-dependent epimerase/dehydratase family protein [Oscillospiraceae bacterium]